MAEAGVNRRLETPLTVTFPLFNMGKVTEQDVVKNITNLVISEEIKAIQITPKECRITLATEEAKNKLKKNKIEINSREVMVNDADRVITSVTKTPLSKWIIM